MIGLSITVDQHTVEDFSRAMERLQRETGRSCNSAVVWGAKNMARSLAARTQVAPKKRKLVKDKETGGWGAMVYDRRTRREVFTPITNETIKLVHFTAKDGRQLVKNVRTGEIRPAGKAHKFDAMQKAGAATSYLRNIHYSGLAKRSWQWMGTAAGKDAVGNVLGVASASVHRRAFLDGGMNIILHNKLDYALDALTQKGGEAAIQNAMEAAANQMHKKLDDDLLRATR